MGARGCPNRPSASRNGGAAVEPLADASDDTVAAAPIDLSVLGPLEPFAAAGAGHRPVRQRRAAASGSTAARARGHEPGWFADEAEVRALAVRLIARGGRHVDEATPAVDVRLGRGIRVHVVLPPVSATGTLISVRVPRTAGFSLAALARAGMLDAAQRQRLGERGRRARERAGHRCGRHRQDHAARGAAR